MANPFRYHDELRNNSGATVGAGLTVHSSYEVMQRTTERDPGLRPLSACRLF
jgi:hypothetical protein